MHKVTITYNRASTCVSAALPQHWMTGEEDLFIQQRNFRVEQEEPERPQTKEEQEEPEPPQIKEEPRELCISQDEEHLDLKQETDTLMEIPTYEEDESSEADLNNQQSFNVTDSQDEGGNQHEESTSTTDGETESTSTTDGETESTSTTDEETDPQNRDQRKRRDRRHVQSVDSFQMSAGQCDSDVRKNPKKANLGKKYKQSQKEETLASIRSGKNSRIISNPSGYMETGSDERCYICKKCSKSFCNKYLFRIHARIHAEDKQFSCKECEKSFSRISHLKSHMITHTGERPFFCKECNKSFRDVSYRKTHMRTHTGEKPFSCEECKKSFSQISYLKRHMRIHTGEKLIFCNECKKGFHDIYTLNKHMRTHTGERPFSCKECDTSFIDASGLKRHMVIHTGEKPFSCKECDTSFRDASGLK
uniref:C2H2-type domain-containing protein n=1 Tax=Oryzias sinensis TaxID=183150 RepID=A0A8C7WYT5_9TELE